MLRAAMISDRASIRFFASAARGLRRLPEHARFEPSSQHWQHLSGLSNWVFSSTPCNQGHNSLSSAKTQTGNSRVKPGLSFEKRATDLPAMSTKGRVMAPTNVRLGPPDPEASFMRARDPAEAVEVLDLLLKFLGDGERWVKGALERSPGEPLSGRRPRFCRQPSRDQRRGG